MGQENGTSTPWSTQDAQRKVTGVPELGAKHDDVCRGCILGKYAKETFPRSDNKADGMLGLIHSDICGLMSTRALSGAEYFITFIDYLSQKTWIYFLKIKDKVLIL